MFLTPFGLHVIWCKSQGICEDHIGIRGQILLEFIVHRKDEVGWPNKIVT